MLSRIFLLLSLTISFLSLAMESGPNAFGNPEPKKEEEIAEISIKNLNKDIFPQIAEYCDIPAISLFLKKELLNKFTYTCTDPENQKSVVFAPTISPDETLIAYGLSDGKIRIVDLHDRSNGKTCWSSTKKFVKAIEFTPDSNYLATLNDITESIIYLFDFNHLLNPNLKNKLMDCCYQNGRSFAQYGFGNGTKKYHVIFNYGNVYMHEPTKYQFKKMKNTDAIYPILKRSDLNKIFYIDTYLEKLIKSPNAIKRAQFLLLADLKKTSEQNKQLTLHANDGYHIAYKLLPEDIRSALAHLVVVTTDENKNESDLPEYNQHCVIQ